MFRKLLAVAVITATVVSPSRLGAQDGLQTWISHVLLTAASTTLADVVANKPGMGAVFGIAYSVGQDYLDLRVKNWEVGKTSRGAGIIAPIVVGLGLTIMLHGDAEDGEQENRIRLEYPCAGTDEPGEWTGRIRFSNRIWSNEADRCHAMHGSQMSVPEILPRFTKWR